MGLCGKNGAVLQPSRQTFTWFKNVKTLAKPKTTPTTIGALTICGLVPTKIRGLACLHPAQ